MADGWIVAIVSIKTGLYITSFLASGTVFFLVAVRPNGPGIHPRTRLLAALAAALGVVFLILHVALQAAFLSDDGLRGLFDADMLKMVVDGPSGLANKVLLLGLLLVLSVCLLPNLPVILFGWPSGLGGLFIVISFTLTGHTLGEMAPLSTALIVFHLIAVSFWFGALLPLYRQVKDHQIADLTRTANTFGRQAMIVVPMLLLAGTVLAVLLVGSLTALFTSSYGMFLMAKIFAVAALLTLAMLNKYRFVPAIEEGEAEALAQFATTLRLEVLVFSVIYLATAILTTVLGLPTG